MGPSWAYAFMVAALLTLTVTPLLRRVATATGFVDHPVAAHKTHELPTPYLGGVGLMAAVFAALLLTGRLTPLVAVIALGGGLIGCLGLLDDHRSINPAVRFGFEVVVAAVVVAAGLGLQATGIAAVDGLLTIIWIVGLTNAVNFLDNMDGLAAGVSAAAATAILALAVLGGQLVTATLAAGLAGACIGFLAYNKRPASIFMGDAGSLFLGFVLAVTSLGLSPTLTPLASFAVSLMLMALPVLDTITVTVARLRRGRSVIVGGKDHLSHRLVARGLSPGAAVGVLVAVEAAVGTLAVLAGRGRWPLLGVAAAAAVLAVLTLVTTRAPVYEEPVVAVGHSVDRLPASSRVPTTCASRLRQILLNFATNAVKFTAAGEVVLRAGLAEEPGPDGVTLRVEVTDTGVGVDPDTAERLFEPFTQADASTTRRHGGTGPGLAMCRRLAEAMGGTVGVDSQPASGSTFWLRLPLAYAAEPVAPAAPTSHCLAGRRVLVVDDNQTSRVVLISQLRARDIIADQCADGSEAVVALRTAAALGRSYDLALLDMAMPGMDGLELAAEIGADPQLEGVRLLLLSSASVDAAAAAEAGVAHLTDQAGAAVDPLRWPGAGGVGLRYGGIGPAVVVDQSRRFPRHPADGRRPCRQPGGEGHRGEVGLR